MNPLRGLSGQSVLPPLYSRMKLADNLTNSEGLLGPALEMSLSSVKLLLKLFIPNTERFVT